jgi:GTP pyrophosphokinase
VGIGKIDNKMLKDFANSRSNSLVSYFKSKIKKPQVSLELDKDEITAKYDQLVFGKEEDKLEYKLSNCCNPIPGDNVFGFISVNDGIKVHKKDCPNALQLQSNYAYRIIQSKWIDSSQQDFKAVINLKGIDNLGLVSEITQEISSNMHVNMKNLNFDSSDGVFSGRITLVVKNNNILNTIIQRLKKINGIDKVSRE